MSFKYLKSNPKKNLNMQLKRVVPNISLLDLDVPFWVVKKSEVCLHTRPNITQHPIVDTPPQKNNQRVSEA